MTKRARINAHPQGFRGRLAKPRVTGRRPGRDPRRADGDRVSQLAATLGEFQHVIAFEQIRRVLGHQGARKAEVRRQSKSS